MALPSNPNAFPHFKDGDVRIILSDQGGKYNLKLHSFVLALHSKFFKGSMSKGLGEYPNRTGKKANARFCYRLEHDANNVGATIKLTHVEHVRITNPGQITTTSEPPTTGSKTSLATILFPPDESSSESDGHDGYETDLEEKELIVFYSRRRSIADAHYQVFRAIYHLPIDFYGPVIVNIDLILAASAFYGCISLASSGIDQYLHRWDEAYDQVLNGVLTEPIRTIERALKLQARWLFTAAMVKVVSKGQDLFDELMPELRRLGLLELSRGLREKFHRQLLGVDDEMMEMLYVCSQTDCQYASLAAQFVLEWFEMRRYAKNQGSFLAFNYAGVYHKLQAGDVGRNPEKVRKFLRTRHPEHFDKAQEHFYACLPSIINNARTIIEPIMKVTTKYDIGTSPYRDLACIEISQDQIPWITPPRGMEVNRVTGRVERKAGESFSFAYTSIESGNAHVHLKGLSTIYRAKSESL